MAEVGKAKFIIGTTPQQDAAEAKRKEEEREKERQRQLSFQEESKEAERVVDGRRRDLMAIRERLMYQILPKSALGLPPGQDITEAMFLLKAVENIDGMIEMCSMRIKFIKDGIEERYVNNPSAWGVKLGSLLANSDSDKKETK